MTESIKRRTAALANNSDAIELKQLLDAARTELVALRALADELRTDHATVATELTAIGTTLADFKTKYEAHRHSVAGAASTGTAPSTAAATAGTTASTLTDTSGSSVPATLTAAATAESLAE